MKLRRAAFALFLFATPLAAAQELRGKTLDVWLERIEPSADDLSYAAIPWRPTFWEAVREAQATEQPILLWAMNGHPLGCT